MLKKFITACIAMAAMSALPIVPTASASPIMTEYGTPAGAGVAVTGQNTGNAVFTGPFNVSCDNVHLSGLMTSNTGTKIQASFTSFDVHFNGSGSGGDCTSALGSVKWTMNWTLCLETVTGTDTVKLTGCGSSIQFTLEITGTGPCKYSIPSISGTYGTNADATVTLSEQIVKKSEGSFFCPLDGKLDMFFDLTTPSGVTLSIA